MNYMKWTIVILPVVFEEFKVVYIFWLLFSLFTISKNLEELQRPPPLPSPNPPVSTGLDMSRLSEWFIENE